MNRIFISYRSADGAKDASRLADDLGRVFGADHVFLDRQDLRGGSSWRQEIERAIGHRPIVLLLVTPGFVGARHADGRLRIDDADDPVRMEIQSAIDAGAVLMPLRVDGTPMPSAGSLPEPLRVITERHALPLRTDDWTRLDLPRIVADVERLGVPRTGATAAEAVRPVRSNARRWALAAAVVLAVTVLAHLANQHASELSLPPTAAGGAEGTSSSAQNVTRPVAALAADRPSLDGRWLLTTQNGERIPLYLRQRDDRLSLRSEPVRVDNDPAWRDYIATLAAMEGPPLTHIVFTAHGAVFGDVADLAVRVVSADGSFLVDSGNLTLRIGPERRVLAGKVELNSGEKNTVVLSRRP
ncbi:toll/interleukin-1 receptor domain-containing protein [Methyloversatilis discipulorum]|uniref:toll/interleukin-1 receptor domain-containing protein n=1 Tax=Methyloversatilis discipulorum TaxID=1119528 RepID=UPI001A3C7B8A|nr:toll/interleukin-1 receptor domain-containing protein [Methyloversatilis discipulorum]MBL8468532.1 toll/interleukin-1 receptor domain-containing protein [Methyloversatilis discipulorum]